MSTACNGSGVALEDVGSTSDWAMTSVATDAVPPVPPEAPSRMVNRSPAERFDTVLREVRVASAPPVASAVNDGKRTTCVDAPLLGASIAASWEEPGVRPVTTTWAWNRPLLADVTVTVPTGIPCRVTRWPPPAPDGAPLDA